MSALATRFAPSPTGRLHLGHAYSAVIAHQFARERGGRFLLRIDDIDAARSRPEYIEAALDDLAWLGLDWDEELLVQSQRLERYDAALATLKAAGLAYPCFCTRAEIAAEQAAAASAPHGDFPPPYPGTCRRLTAEDCARRMREAHCWRLDMRQALDRTGPLFWDDAGLGRIAAAPDAAGDVILARKDAPSSYHLASTIDDADMGVTDVVRGRDLFASTHVHRLLQALLDLPTPLYHHHALIAGADGRRLAKRDGAAELASLRAAGVDGRALAKALSQGQLPTGYSLVERA